MQVIGGSGDPLNPHVETGQRTVQRPPDMSQEAFDAAITELKQLIGEEFVEMNDAPFNHGE